MARLDTEAADAATAATAEAVEIVNPGGRADLVLVCEHASNRIPDDFAGLGLAPALLDSHIAWDIGAVEAARHMASLLDAPLVAPRWSRLLYDCNRPPEAPDAVVTLSEIHAVPGNEGLDAAAVAARAARFYHPFRTALGAVLEARIAAGRPPVLASVHSFTPVYRGVARDVDVGVLHDADSRLADAVLDAAAADPGLADLRIRRNAPYGPGDGVTHTLKVQAMARDLPNVMFEVRNDMLADPRDCRIMADRLARLLDAAVQRIGITKT